MNHLMDALHWRQILNQFPWFILVPVLSLVVAWILWGGEGDDDDADD